MTTVEEARKRAERDALRNRIHLCPDPNMLNELLVGLTENEKRYGYPSCPCRIASGNLETDRDILCPCDYRDPDVEEYGQCFCALYVSEAVHKGEQSTQSIPERRPMDKQMAALGMGDEPEETKDSGEGESTDRKLLYCKQCGYVVLRDEPPYKCPICGAKRELFGEIVVGEIKVREI